MKAKKEFNVYYLIGEKLKHSFSAVIHRGRGYDYSLREISEDRLEAFFKERNFDGLNVTIPYKTECMKYLDFISPLALSVGAVNTVVNKGGRLYGFNTDAIGFYLSLRRKNIELSGKVLILGSGGASKAVRAVCERCSAEYVVISRTGENNYGNIDRHYDADIIVNTTPVGMYPDCEKLVLDIEPFKNLKAVCDLIYNPYKTPLLAEAEKRGIVWQNGADMLTLQALASEKLFDGAKDEDNVAIENFTSLKMQNLVLIGMPFCGKSTVGMRLAERLGREFVDLDTEIEKAGLSIKELIASGEDAFREVESEFVKKYAFQSNLVISTGGGVVERRINTDRLRQNGNIVYITRKSLPETLENRPLAQNIEQYENLKKRRAPLYEAAADIIIDNDSSVDDTVDKIIKWWSRQ